MSYQSNNSYFFLCPQYYVNNNKSKLALVPILDSSISDDKNIALESRNNIYVINWNQRVLNPQRYNPNLYEMQIDYSPNIDYGYEVNYKFKTSSFGGQASLHSVSFKMTGAGDEFQYWP